MTIDPRLHRIVVAQPLPLARRNFRFATIGGAHIYGFPSRDSALSLRLARVNK